jgi:phosphatidylserine decarboxylase
MAGIAREGIPYIAVPLVAGLSLAAFGHVWLALLLLGLAAFMLYFFRDPHRTAPTESGVIVAPADGRVTRVRRLAPEDAQSPTIISIFLSPFDVHINRAPLAGLISDVSYTRGRFLMATREEASLVNEQNAITIQGEQVTVVCKQIAGILARRIVCWKRAGDTVRLGERFGLIKFSSRTDLILPPEVEVTISEGARVRGGVTVVGKVR